MNRMMKKHSQLRWVDVPGYGGGRLVDYFSQDCVHCQHLKPVTEKHRAAPCGTAEFSPSLLGTVGPRKLEANERERCKNWRDFFSMQMRSNVLVHVGSMGLRLC